MTEISEALKKAAQTKSLSPEETVLFLEKMRLPPKFDVRKIAESNRCEKGTDSSEKNAPQPQKK